MKKQITLFRFIFGAALALVPLVIFKELSGYLSLFWLERSYTFAALASYLIVVFWLNQKAGFIRKERLSELNLCLAAILIMAFLIVLIMHLCLAYNDRFWLIFGWSGLASASILIASSRIIIRPRPKKKNKKRKACRSGYIFGEF